jgi:agmatinase
MTNDTTFYRANPLVQHQEENGTFSVRNSMTGIAYKLSPASFNIYDFIRRRAPISSPEIVASFTEFPEDNVREIIAYFHQHHLLVTGSASDTAALTKKDITLFDLPDTGTEQQLCLIGVPFGQGNPMPNSCSNFPDNFRVYMREKRLSFAKQNIRCNAVTNDSFGITDNYDLSAAAFQWTRDLGNIFLDAQFESKKTIYNKIHQVAKEVFAKQVPFFLGGDHSISYSTIKAAAEQYDKLTIIQLDAHTDTYTSRKEELGDENLHHHGNFMSRCLALPAVKKVYQLGIRGDVNFGLPPAGPKEVIVPCSALRRSLQQGTFQLDIPEDHKIYITIDIDVLDPQYAPATATPVGNGLSLEDLLACLRIIYDQYHQQLVGFDLVEVSPHRDDESRTTAISASYIILQIIQRFSYYAKDN